MLFGTALLGGMRAWRQKGSAVDKALEGRCDYIRKIRVVVHVRLPKNSQDANTSPCYSRYRVSGCFSGISLQEVAWPKADR